jgi:predicted naringenin-chalcone synthase
LNLLSISNVVPEFSLTQKESWEVFKRSNAHDAVNDRSRQLIEKVLCSENGIDKRHYSVEDIKSLFDRDAEALYRLFEKKGPELSVKALRGALDKTGLNVEELDALYVCTCTGYLCPGLSSYIAEQLGMRSNIYLQDIVGLGCGAAVPTLRSASYFTHANPKAKIAVVAVEICSAAFYIDNDPGVLISLCLFGDGCSASIWTGEGDQGLGRLSNFDTLHIPEKRDMLRFENKGGKLRNLLHLTVPAISSRAVNTLYRRHQNAKIDQIISHGGGRDVLKSIESKIPEFSLRASKEILRQYGNMSSPSVLFGLENHLEHSPDDRDLWLVSFGAGFACHSCFFNTLG